MPLAQLVIHSAVAGFSEAAGLSGAAHTMALGLWVAPPDPAVIAGAAGLGTGLGVVLTTRARLFPALSEGVRALSHPSSFFVPRSRAREALVLAWIAAVSAALSLLLRKAGAAPPTSPHALAIGLGGTGIALLLGGWAAAVPGDPATGRAGTRGAATPARQDLPTFAAATLAGAAHAFGVWPGASRVGLAAAVLFAVGVRPARALHLALVATVPFWWADFVTALPDAGALGKGHALLATLFAFLGSLGASALLRLLVQRRAIVVLSCWIIPLALAIFAYSRVA